MARLRRQPRGQVRRHGPTPSGRCGRWSSTGSTPTWSAAGGSPCRTWSRPACCASRYQDLDRARRRRTSILGQARPPGVAGRPTPALREELGRRSCSTSCAGSWPSTSTASTEHGFDRLAPRVPPAPARARGRWPTANESSRSAPRSRAAGQPGGRRGDLNVSGRGGVRPLPAPRRRRPAAQALTADDAQEVIARPASTSSSSAGLLDRRRRTQASAEGYRLKASAPAAGRPVTGPRAPRTRSAGAATSEAAPGQPVLPRPLPRRRREPGRAARQGAHRPGAARRPARNASTSSAPATLPLLYCSPTMELGVDIASLNAVGAAQRPAHPGQLRAALRAGRPLRAARPGRHLLRHRQRPRHLLLPPLPATWSPARSPPPRLDLANEDLVRSHVHAIWLAETGQSLRARDHRPRRGRRRQPDPERPAPRSGRP